MRQSDVNFTMQTYTDPKLLNVRAALEALPALPLSGRGGQEPDTPPCHTEGDQQLALGLALPQYKPGQTGSIPGNEGGPGTPSARGERLDVRSCPDKRNTPLSSADSGVQESGREDLNFRPHGPEPI